MKNIVLIIFLLFVKAFYAQNYNKLFKSLVIEDFQKVAIEIEELSQEKKLDTTIISFANALIYANKNYKDFNPIKAYKLFIEVLKVKSIETKQLNIIIEKFEFNLESIKNDIESKVFEYSKINSSIEKYNEIIKICFSCDYLENAKVELEKLEYLNALKNNTINQYNAFLQKYPTSQQKITIENRIDFLTFNLSKNNYFDLKKFINTNPNSNYKDEAIILLDSLNKSIETILYYRNQNEKIACKGKYLDGKRYGDWFSFFENGQIQTQIKYSKNKILEFTEYDINGRKINYINFIEGNWLIYFENSKKVKYDVSFLNGKPSGKWIRFYESGLIMEKRDYSTGEYISYFENGQIKSKYFLYEEFTKLKEKESISRMHKVWDLEKFSYDPEIPYLENFTFSSGEKNSDMEVIVIENILGIPHFDAKFSDMSNFSEILGKNRPNHSEFTDIFINVGKKNGDFTTFYANGQLHEKGKYTDGELDGEWISYFENGKIDEKGQYVNGVLSGEWISYYENGKIHQKGNCSNGLWCAYDEEGKIYEKGKFAENKPAEEWTYYDNFSDKSQLISKRNFSTGEYILYEENGQIIEKINFKNGDFKMYFENGKILLQGQFDNEKPVGNWITFNQNGSIFKILKVNYGATGKSVSDSISYFDNGNIIRQKVVYHDENGKKIREDERLGTGNWETYLYNTEGNRHVDEAFYNQKNGNNIRSEINEFFQPSRDDLTFYNQSASGNESVWIPNDEEIQFFQQGIFQDNKKEGEWISYNRNDGSIYQKSNFKNGKLHGFRTYYYGTDKIGVKEYYINGKLDCRIEN